MNLELIVRDEAEDDMAEAVDWYQQRRDGLGEEVIQCFRNAIHQVARTPLGGTEVLPGVRRVVVSRFPYVVIYSVDARYVSVIAVYHTSRDPTWWHSRLVL